MRTLNLESSCFMILVQCLLFRSQYACAKSFRYGEFNGSSIILLKDASIYSNRVLTLTNRTQRSMSRVLYPNPIKIKGENDSVLSFSTTFLFAIAAPSVGMHGNGLAFIIAPNKSIAGATDSQYLGLSTPESNGLESNHFLAVEFDLVYDPDLGDIHDNHVGVNKNCVKSFASQRAAYWTDNGNFNNLCLKSGDTFQAWIDYNHVQDRLNVSVAVVGMKKPLQPLISISKVNISGVLKEEVYAGFTASTGTYAIEGHYILGWSFTTEGKAPPLDLTDLPSFINGMYDVEEMELVLKLGLVCSHPEPERRVDITTVLQILEGQAPFPAPQILWISYDSSYRGYGSGFVHITDEEVTADQLASVPMSGICNYFCRPLL